jgi:hypothetical protein
MKKRISRFHNNSRIIGVNADITIGLVSKDLVLTLVQDIVVPIIGIITIKNKKINCILT